MDDPNITMEEYIRLEEEKAQKHGKVFNWETAKYGRIWYDEDVHDLRSIENEFSAIIFNDSLTSNETPSCEPTVSSLNDEIDFRVSFDESDDEDYTVVFNKNSFSYKIISTNDLKKDSKNDDEKVNKPLFLSPEPTISCIDDLDFFKDFENEFSAIVYNDALTMLFNLIKNLYVPFDIPFDPKRYYKDSDCARMLRRPRIVTSIIVMALPPRDQRHQYLRYEGLRYTDADIADFEERLGRIYSREIHRAQVLDFEGMSELMRDVLYARMLMEHRDDGGVMVFTSRAWGRLFETRGSLVRELILEFPSTLRFGEVVLDLDTPGTIQFQLGEARRRMSWREFILALGLHTGEEMESPSFARYPVMRLCHRMMAHSIAGRSQAPEKVTVIDLFYLRGLDVGSVNIPYLLARYLMRFAAGRKSGALISRGQFVARLAEHFGLLTEERLQGLTVIAPALPIIDMAELERGAGGVAKEALVAPGGGDEDEEMPQAVPPLPRTQGERIARLEDEVHGMREALQGQREVLDSMAHDFFMFSTWIITSLTRLMDRAGVPYTRYS
ncbi:hypothetical protein Tco_0006053 [Tanacetum coccineum]